MGERTDGMTKTIYIPPQNTLYAKGIKVFSVTKEAVLGQLKY